jgi:hypothetical protein
VAFFGVYRLLKVITQNNQDKDKGNN